MSKEDVLNYFYTSGTQYGIKETLVIMSCGLAVGMVIYLTYWLTSEKIAYNRKFNWSLVVMLLVTVIVMMLISTNAVKDSRDTMFIFWAMAEGLCVSARNYRLSATTVLFIAAVLILSSKIPGIWNKYLLIVTGEGASVDRKRFEEVLKPFVVSCRIRTGNRDAAHEEMIYEIKTKGELKPEMIDELMAVPGIQSVNWVAESGETVG